MTGQRSTAGRTRALVLASLLALTTTARAEEREPWLPTDARLARLVEQSLAALPELSRAQNKGRADTERVRQAEAWPDPMLQVGVQNMGFTSFEVGRDPMSYVSFMASQTVPWPGKLGLRRELAELSVSQADRSVARVRLSTEADVRRAYLELLLTRDRLSLLDQLDALWKQSLGVAQARYETGEGSQSDFLRAQLELNRSKLRRFALHAQERSVVQALNRLRNHPLDEPIDTELHVRDLPAPRTLAHRFSVEQALAHSPELASARLSVARADKAVALAGKSYFPDLTFGAGVMVRGSLPPMWLLTAGGTLPVFAGSKQSHAVEENRALASAAQAEAVALEQVLRLRSHERRTVFDALLQAIDLYDQGLLVQSEATGASTLAQYKVGKVSFASVLEANAGLIADEEGYLQALAAAHRLLIAEAELSLAPAALPAPMAASGSMTSAGAASLSLGASGAAPLEAGERAAPVGPSSGSMPSM